jgi:hypothetical protein
MEAITDINPQALYAAEAISEYLKKEGHSDHDVEGNIRFIWQTEHEGSLVELHMIKTTQDGMYALAVADYGHDGELARKWSKKNKGHFKKVKSLLMQHMMGHTVYDTETGTLLGE